MRVEKGQQPVEMINVHRYMIYYLEQRKRHSGASVITSPVNTGCLRSGYLSIRYAAGEPTSRPARQHACSLSHAPDIISHSSPAKLASASVTPVQLDAPVSCRASPDRGDVHLRLRLA